MKHSPPYSCTEQGATFVEMMVASAVLSVVASAVLVGSITLQKSFRASQQFALSQASQLRLIDYVSLDLRRALSVTIPQRDRIHLQIPGYYNADGSIRDPQIVRNSNGRSGIRYGVSSIAVSYYIERGADGVSGSLIREEGGVKKTIATDVRDFLPDFERSSDSADDSEQVFKVSVTFAPKYRWKGDGSSVRDGTRIASRILLRNKRTR